MMKNKIKKFAYAASSGLLLLPSLALAQFEVEPVETGLPKGTIVDILSKGMQWLLYLVGIIGVIGFVIAGIMYLTAAGDDDQIGKAKKAMFYSIMGVVVALVGVVILQAVKAWLGGSTTTF